MDCFSALKAIFPEQRGNGSKKLKVQRVDYKIHVGIKCEKALYFAADPWGSYDKRYVGRRQLIQNAVV